MHKIGFYKRKIEEALREVTVSVHYKNKLGDFSENKNAEEFYRGLLNEVFDWDLKNANTPETPNYEGVDLLDRQRNLAIQVTSEKRTEKITRSIVGFKNEALKDGYTTLYVLMFKGKVDTTKVNVRKEVGNDFVFNKNKHVIDHSDLLKQLADAELDKLENVYNYLKRCRCFPQNQGLPHELTNKFPTLDLKKIIGREDDLEEVRQLLTQNKQVVVVNGVGGIGKTTLAQVYLTQYAEQYDHVIWMSQSDGDNFMLDLINAEGLMDNLGITSEEKDVKTRFHQIITKLKGVAAKPKLWIIDNANASLYAHLDHLPKPPNWHILATSRERIEDFAIKELGFLSEENAVLLFKQHYTRTTDETEIRSVLKTIDYHTLTIEILAKTAQRRDTSLATLQQAIEKDLKSGVPIPHKGGKIDRVTSYLLSIFDISSLNDEERLLLQHFAALPTEFISYELLKKLIPADEDGIAGTLEDLADKGWLMRLSEPEAYKIHRIIQEVVKRRLPPTVDLLYGFINNVGTLLHIDKTKGNPVDKFPFISYGEAVLTVFPDATDEVISYLQNNLATVLRVSGNYSGAKTLLEKAIISAEVNFGENHPTTTVCYSNLATVLKDLGDYSGAKVLLEKVMIFAEANFGKKHPNTALSYSNLAMVLKDLGDYNGAKVLLEKAIISDEANFGEKHPTTAGRYSNLGTVLQDLGDYSGAKFLLEKAMISYEANFGEKHPTTAVTYSNLAMVLKDLGDYKSAKVLLEKAMISDEANFGEKHPTTAVTYSNLAGVLQDLGDYSGAKVLFQKAMISYETNFGEKHPTTAQRYSNLAMVLHALGDYNGAKVLLEKAIISDKANFGEKHPTTAVSYSNLAMVLQDLGDYSGAKALLEKAMISAEANLGEKHPDTAVCYSNLAGVLADLKEYKEAFLLMFKAYQIMASHFEENHPYHQRITNNLNVLANKMLQNGWTKKQIQTLLIPKKARD